MKKNILLLDTSASETLLIIRFTGKEIIHQSFGVSKNVEELIPLIDRFFTDNNLNKKELEAVGVCEGPGSFTGIRIGISTALGLTVFQNIHLFGFNIFDIYRYSYQNVFNTAVIPVIDGKKKQFYCTVIMPGEDIPVKYYDLTREELKKLVSPIQKPVIFCGPDSRIIEEDFPYQNFTFENQDGYDKKTLLSFVDTLIADKTLRPPQPLYIRQSDAEIVLIESKSVK